MRELKRTGTTNLNEQFLTFDLGLASALTSLGYELLDLDRANPRKVQFIFKRAKGIDKLTEDYWSNRLMVNARTFFDNQKMLKNRIYSE